MYVMCCVISGNAAVAQPVEGIRSRITQPIAPRGGIMMLPLEADDGTDNWPASIDIHTADEGMLSGTVAWIHAVSPGSDRHWTEDPRSLAIRAVQPSDDIARANLQAGEGPYLLIEMPVVSHGSLKLGKQTLKPLWVDLPPEPALDATQSLEGAAFANDRPDPASPFEYSRWAVRAIHHHEPAPLPAGDAVQRLAALHYAQLWCIGLHLLDRHDAGLAREVRHLLTRTCSDRTERFAAWLADPQAAGALLDRLLHGLTKPEGLVEDVRGWVVAQSPLVIWPVSEFGDQVGLAAFTFSDDPVTATLRWEGASEGSAVARFEPGVLTHVNIDRLPPGAGRGGLTGAARMSEPARQALLIETGRHELRLEFGPRQTIARTPGVYLSSFRPPLTLAEAQARFMRGWPADRATTAELRRISGRWELFVESLRPTAATPASPPPNWSVRTVEDLRGHEAITIMLGEAPEAIVNAANLPQATHGMPPSSPNAFAWLTVPETGWQQLVRGHNDGTLQVHRRSLDDRWFCRIVVPETWLPTPGQGPLKLALIRSHGDSSQLECCPGLSVPWRAATAPIAIDLEHWDDLPRGE
jgi:hypothetical protein